MFLNLKNVQTFLQMIKNIDHDDIENFFLALIDCSLINKLLDNINAVFTITDGECYQVFLNNSYIGSVKVDYYFSAENRKTKLMLLKDVLLNDLKARENIIEYIIDYNINVLELNHNIYSELYTVGQERIGTRRAESLNEFCHLYEYICDLDMELYYGNIKIADYVQDKKKRCRVPNSELTGSLKKFRAPCSRDEFGYITRLIRKQNESIKSSININYSGEQKKIS